MPNPYNYNVPNMAYFYRPPEPPLPPRPRSASHAGRCSYNTSMRALDSRLRKMGLDANVRMRA